MLDHFFYRFKYRFARNLKLHVPVDVSLELASHCNQKCGYCYHADQDNLPFQKGFMDADLATKVINECAKLGVNSLKFNYRGESSMHPRFFAITTVAKQLANGSTFIDRISNTNFKFPTNRDDIFEGFTNQTKVKISFDSFIPGIMEKQRAGSNYELALRNIDKFYNFPRRLKTETKIIIQAVRTSLNKDEDIVSEVRKRWQTAEVSIRDMVGGRVNNDQVKVLENKIRDNSNRQSCIQAHARLIIHWDGKVGPCCPSIKNDLILGDVTKQSVYEIFNGPFANELRRSLKKKTAFNLDPCKTCSSFESYKGFKPRWDS